MPFSRPTNFHGGVAASEDNFWSRFPRPDAVEFAAFFDDFFGSTPVGLENYTLTSTGFVLMNIVDGLGGILEVTNSADDDDVAAFQGRASGFQFIPRKRTWFSIKVAFPEVLELDFVAGLIPTTVDAFNPVSGVWFSKSDGNNQVNFNTSDGVPVTELNIAQFVNNEFLTLSFYFDGLDLFVYLNNQTVLIKRAPTLPAGLMNLTFALKNGEALAKVMRIDYVFAAVERQEV